MVNTPDKTILDVLAFKKEIFSEGERQLVLYILDNKNRMFEKPLWGLNFLGCAE